MASKFTQGAACKGKQRFETYQEGLNSLRPEKARQRNTASKARLKVSSNSFSRRHLTVYRCTYCGKFHVGHGRPERPIDRDAPRQKRGYELPNPPA